MMYVRGNKRDYDRWEDLGNPGWGFKDVLPYFKKSEDNRNPYIAKNTKYHSTGGYQTISEAKWRTPLSAAFVEAAVELGVPNRDCNAEFQTGFMIPQVTIRDGARCSTGKAFLRPIGARKNLHISKHSFVLKILIDPKTKRAYGVKFLRDGKVLTIHARKEVILSAGAINSPQLLMLSGIGPKEHLKSLDIPVIQDLPVGHNLQDHQSMPITFMIDSKVSFVVRRYVNSLTSINYGLNKKGLLTAPAGIEGLGFINTKFVNESLDWPDVEYHFSSANVGSDGGIHAKIGGLKNLFFEKYVRSILYTDGFTIFVMLLRPESRGYIKLRSKSPFHKPLITSNYYTKRRDIETVVEGAKFALKFATTNSLKRFGTRLYLTPFPGCEQFTLYSDEYLECLARHLTGTIYHYSGTAKMGPVWDPGAVVDPELKVYGISGLRVIDASIMPYVVSGNTNAPVIMIGEKGSDLIKEHWFGSKRWQLDDFQSKESTYIDKPNNQDYTSYQQNIINMIANNALYQKYNRTS